MLKYVFSILNNLTTKVLWMLQSFYNFSLRKITDKNVLHINHLHINEDSLYSINKEILSTTFYELKVTFWYIGESPDNFMSKCTQEV